MTLPADLDLAHDAFDRHAWGEVAARLATADAGQPLDIDDLERLAVARHMLGHSDDAYRTWERAHLETLRAGDPVRASRHAFYIVMNLGQRGEFAQAGGWHARATRLLDEAGADCVERGLLLVPLALRARDEGDVTASLGIFDQVAAIAERFGDPDLRALSFLGRGETLVALGEVERGIAYLDEAMVAVTTGEVSPLNVGIVYCGSIEAFQAVFDLGRAQQWTTVLNRWCEAQPDAVPFRSRCLVFRAEILQFHGLWLDADEEVRRAHAWLSRPPIEPAVGEAHYQQAELHRLRGEFAAADSAYREGAKWGRRPDPGLALLRLAQGDLGAAIASIRQALDEADPVVRARLLSERAAGPFRPPLLRAIAARAEGLVRLASGDPRAALPAFRRSLDLWQSLEAPFESARVRLGIALARRELGDLDSASMELAAARETFERLGAVTDLRRLSVLAGAPPPTPAGLSAREVEVLGHLAHGATIREIATSLGISERTVDRHVSNIYAKLDVSSRAAATAFAFEHGLV